MDGFNILTSVEAALSGGVILHCRDGAIRDMASLHGSYRRVQETPDAIAMIARAAVGVPMRWYLDRPVSNSGRLKTQLLEYAQAEGLEWEVELVPDPDPVLKESTDTVVSSDSAILDQAEGWTNLLEGIVQQIASPWSVPMWTSQASRTGK